MSCRMKKLLSVLLAAALAVGLFPQCMAEPPRALAGSLSAYTEGYHHWPGVCLGGARLTAFGADAVSKESYNFSTDSYVQDREMSASDAPVAIYYTDVNKIKTLSDLTAQKGFKMNIRVTDVRYCTV